jgi:hypothetical protein
MSIDGDSPLTAEAVCSILWGATDEYHMWRLRSLAAAGGGAVSIGECTTDRTAWALVPWKAKALTPAGAEGSPTR